MWLLLLKLLAEIKPTKFNLYFLGVIWSFMSFLMGTFIADLKHVFFHSHNNLTNGTELVLLVLIIIAYLFLCCKILIEVCKFLIKKQKKN